MPLKITPAFDQWFSGSKVVDADGKPLVVYHGTSADIQQFKVSDGGEFGGGIYMTPDTKGASDYATYRGRGPANVMPLYVSIKNPADAAEASQVALWKGEQNARAELIKRGYDGVIDMRSGQVVAFYPGQIKSATGNNGQFDSANADISFSRSEFVVRGEQQQALDGVPAFSRVTDDAVTNPKDVVGNTQGGRSADDISPGLTKRVIDAGIDFVSKIESLAEKHGRVYIRWSPSAIGDLSGNQTSRDFQSGEMHSGLSAVEITGDMHPVDIASRLSEYGFLRLQDRQASPHVFLADRVGTDSDGYASIKPKTLLLESDKDVIKAIDSRLSEVMDAMDDVQRHSETLEKNPGHPAVTQRLESAKARLDKILPNESSAPDSDGVPAFSRKADPVQANTPAFRKWFSGSKVVDADGKPLVVYHGTSQTFTAFDAAKQGTTAGVKGGFFFVSDKNVASEIYGWRPGGRVMSVYLRMEHPLGYDEYFALTGKDKDNETNDGCDAPVNYFDNNANEIVAFAEANGFDGLMWPADQDSELPHDLLMVFRRSQIKSATGNNGNFDATNPDIRFSHPNAVTQGAEVVENDTLEADVIDCSGSNSGCAP